ncbi:MAG: nucleotide sugar dehydrogenase, partial [Candidatus Omnitrophota bacterium]
FAILCHKLNIDVWEVIKAARTKPFGFLPFYPGPGIGGHCIPADPMYLSWKARTVGFKTEMVDLAAQINHMMPKYVVKRTRDLLKSAGKRTRGAKVLIVGATYKKDVNDLRESPALDIIESLKKKKAEVAYHDPFIPYLDLYKIRMKSEKLTKELLRRQDIVLVVADHSSLNYKMIASGAGLILDTRNAFGERKIRGDNIVKL